ncbi:class F sortase [Actinoalloteichus fjordicus]|uniref:Sortase family enzyme n=1 Tax=Actinoalloteichus fjordicus TaxID=1612552 RepID=A0AAC9LFS9_9PSEU|nr:class F sortase [Actinoalloteichus fjordicus]APU16891.1 sortase family enzyme [Actinoalloteichus fjordicus]
MGRPLSEDGPHGSAAAEQTRQRFWTRGRTTSLIAVLAAVTIGITVGGLVGNPSVVPGSASAAGDTPSAEAEPTAEETPEAQPAPPPAEHARQPGTIYLADGGSARLVREEVDATGTLPVPDSLGEATWWGAGLGAAAGASVMAGHVNWQGALGPFDQLHRAEVGERIEIVDVDGGEWTYQTSEVLTLHKDELPGRAADLFGQDGDHRLVLVTCGGRYVGGPSGYEDNRIVVATLVGTPDVA